MLCDAGLPYDSGDIGRRCSLCPPGGILDVRMGFSLVRVIPLSLLKKEHCFLLKETQKHIAEWLLTLTRAAERKPKGFLAVLTTGKLMGTPSEPLPALVSPQVLGHLNSLLSNAPPETEVSLLS